MKNFVEELSIKLLKGESIYILFFQAVYFAILVNVSTISNFLLQASITYYNKKLEMIGSDIILQLSYIIYFIQ